ncbi:MAG TPA: gamma-butyrobetaine hydroxylase-like domain-containing protein [Chloroflexota bacterium]|nr:gamma-butyrobetaine hydroxylase-like domain-containing protein [Chloroflexota bacterium]
MQRDDPVRRSPTAIDLDAENGLMQITWADGHVSLYELSQLRRSCPCAGCKGEGGRPGAVNAGTVFSEQQTTLVDVQPLNRFGLQFTWADGHDDGLFSYDLLRRLCPCEACANRRGLEPATEVAWQGRAD